MKVIGIKSLNDFVEIFPVLNDLEIMHTYLEIVEEKQRLYSMGEMLSHAYELLQEIEDFIAGYLSRLCCKELGHIQNVF